MSIVLVHRELEFSNVKGEIQEIPGTPYIFHGRIK